MHPIPVLSIVVAVIAFLLWLIAELRDARRVIRILCGCLVFLAMFGGIAESEVYADVLDGKGRVSLTVSLDQCIYAIEHDDTERLLADLKRYRQSISSHQPLHHELADLHDALLGESRP